MNQFVNFYFLFINDTASYMLTIFLQKYLYFNNLNVYISVFKTNRIQ